MLPLAGAVIAPGRSQVHVADSLAAGGVALVVGSPDHALGPGHTLFETTIISPQLRLFDLGEALGKEGWMKFLKLDELQQELFTCEEAI